MSRPKRKISLIYFAISTLLLVGMVPLVLTGWLLSDRSARELRAVENRYQIQLVQEKARQIELFGQHHSDIVKGIAKALELAGTESVLSSPDTEAKLGTTLRENPNLLAIYIRPQAAEPVALFRPNALTRADTEAICDNALRNLTTQPLLIGRPQKLGQSSESILTIASPITMNGSAAASVVAIVSLREISRSVVGTSTTSEADMWAAGLPIIFVVDGDGRAVFHPDSSLVEAQKPMGNLRIVDEWQQSNAQIQSGLVPFTAEFNDESYDMIGAYSTVRFGNDLSLGVITMQDERKALASVGEMKTQTWLISLAFAFVAMLVGSIAARTLTAPIMRLDAAAGRVAAGDFSTRVETRNMTEIGTLGESFNTMTDKLEEHIARLAKAAQENRELFVGTVKALSAAIDGKDKYTRGHSERVARISVAIGKQMGMPADELETLRISALLHDVGKIAIDDNILKKPAALTDEEFAIMKTHPQKGYKIMSQIPAMKEFLPGMYMHHEMVNGQGYPQGLTDKEIPLQAKIVSVADTFDAMTIDRPYQKGMLLPEALEKIKSMVGTRYDGGVVSALIRGCDAGEIGQGVVRFLVNAKNAEIEANIDAGIEADIDAEIDAAVEAAFEMNTKKPPVDAEIDAEMEAAFKAEMDKQGDADHEEETLRVA
jgi:HD-GYP domain-containing protein (c-di-GMP phosphodiesterase class II)